MNCEDCGNFAPRTERVKDLKRFLDEIPDENATILITPYLYCESKKYQLIAQLGNSSFFYYLPAKEV